MVLPDLESAFRGMLERIAEKGGSNVEMALDSFPQHFRIDRANGAGKVVETFIARYYPQVGKPIVTYGLLDRGLLGFTPCNVNGLLNGIQPTVADSDAFKSFVRMINDEAAKNLGGAISCQNYYHPNRMPYFVARFAARMIPGLTD